MAMFDKMQQMKKLYGLQKKARAIQKELKNTEISAVSSDGKIEVIFTGDQKLDKINLSPEILKPENAAKIESALEKTIAEALKEAQKLATSKMKSISGELGLGL